MSYNAHELSNRLLNALDTNYNVVDMHTVNDIISILEKFNITKELLETTRLGKHVNELRRKTKEPTLARRAKVLVKRWRDLVIPAAASPAHTGSNRSSAERQVRLARLGGTPLTSPALTTSVTPAVSSPRPATRPAWGGYESDSQDVILVDDDPPIDVDVTTPAPIEITQNTSLKALSPVTISNEKKSKREKKPRKRRADSKLVSESGDSPWGVRNGAGRKNGCARPPADAYAALVNRIPVAGGKKVKTTKELLREIQSRGNKPTPLSPHSVHSANSSAPHSPTSPHSPDVMLIEPEPSPPLVIPPSPVPLDDCPERPPCSCEEFPSEQCEGARSPVLRPAHVRRLHHAYIPGVNGTRAPVYPHQPLEYSVLDLHCWRWAFQNIYLENLAYTRHAGQTAWQGYDFAVRKLTDPETPDLFTSVVPLYKYSDYADDYCSKNMSKIPLCTHLPWTEWAPSPPSPPRPKTPPTPRPYPIEEIEIKVKESDSDMEVDESIERLKDDTIKVETEIETDSEVSLKLLEDRLKPICDIAENHIDIEPNDRLKADPESIDKEEAEEKIKELKEEVKVPVIEFERDNVEHRTVEKTKDIINGQTLFDSCSSARESIPFSYNQVEAAPVVGFDSDDVIVDEAFSSVMTDRDEMGRPIRPVNFAEWHECARLGELIALPYVVID